MSLLNTNVGGAKRLLKYSPKSIKLNFNPVSNYGNQTYGLKIDDSNGLVIEKDINSDIGWRIDNPHFERYNIVQIQFTFMKTANTTFAQIIGEVGSYWKQPNIWFTSNTKINFGVPCGQDMWTNAYAYNGIQNGFWYTIWAEINNSSRLCKFKLYDENNTLIDSKEYTFNTISYRDVNYIGFMFGTDIPHNFVGKIDVVKSFIKCDGNLIWGVSGVKPTEPEEVTIGGWPYDKGFRPANSPNTVYDLENNRIYNKSVCTSSSDFILEALPYWYQCPITRANSLEVSIDFTPVKSVCILCGSRNYYNTAGQISIDFNLNNNIIVFLIANPYNWGNDVGVVSVSSPNFTLDNMKNKINNVTVYKPRDSDVFTITCNGLSNTKTLSPRYGTDNIVLGGIYNNVNSIVNGRGFVYLSSYIKINGEFLPQV